MKRKSKKPTLKEMQTVTENLIMESQFLKRRLSSCELVINEYIHWKKDGEKFKKYFEKSIEDGIKNGKSNNRQQNISKSKGSSKTSK